MRNIAIGCGVVILLVLIVGLCFGVLDDDETEIEIEESRLEWSDPWDGGIFEVLPTDSWAASSAG